MRLLVIGLLIVAVVIAGAVVFFMNTFIDSKTAEVEKTLAARTQVLVAAVDLGIGTSIVRDHLKWQAWPEDGVAPEYAVNVEGRDVMSDFLGAVIRKPMSAGEPIVPSRMIKRDQPGFMAAVLPPGMRAVTVKVNVNTSTGGFILPGDYVDILLTHNLYVQELKKARAELEAAVVSGVRKEQRSYGIASIAELKKLPQAIKFVTETILTNRRVLALDTLTGHVEGTSRISKNVTLEVTPKEMQIIMNAAKVGTLSLSLRSIRPGADVTDEDLLISTADVEVSPLLQALLRKPGETEELPSLVSAGLNVIPPSLFEKSLPAPEIMMPQEPPKIEEMPKVEEMPKPEPPKPVVIAPELTKPAADTEKEKAAKVPVKPKPKERSIKVYLGGQEKPEEWRSQ